MERVMSKEKEELLEAFEKLGPDNRANVLAYVRVAYTAQEATKKALGYPSALGKEAKTA